MALNDLEIADRAGTSEIELVLAAAAIARVSTLSSARVRLAMLDGHAFAKLLTASGCGSLFAESMLQELVLGDRDRAATVERRVGALRPQRARTAGVGWKLDLGAEDDGLLLPGWAGDGAVAHVDRELALAEVRTVVSEPGAADDRPAPRQDSSTIGALM